MGEERSGRERPRPGHRLGRDWVKDETHTASHTDPHRPGEQPPSVRMGTHEWQLDTQQAADSKGTAPEGERSSHSALSPAAHYFRSLREDRNACVCVWGWGPEAGGRGCRGAPGAGPRHPQLAAAPRPCWEPPHPLAGRCFRNFGWGGALGSLFLSSELVEGGDPSPSVPAPAMHESVASCSRAGTGCRAPEDLR